MTSWPLPSAPCPTTHDFLNGVDSSIGVRTAGMMQCAISSVRWSWIRETLGFSLLPQGLTDRCGTMHEPERLLIALSWNQRILVAGFGGLGPRYGNELIF